MHLSHRGYGDSENEQAKGLSLVGGLLTDGG